MELTALGLQVAEQMAGMAAHKESEAVEVLLKDLPTPLRFEIDEAIGDYVGAVGRAYFLAGVQLAANPLALLVE